MSRTEKYQLLVDECVAKMNEDDRAIYLPILEYALELGFTPKLIKKANDEDGELAFSKSKFNRTILRILPENKKEFANYPLKKAGKAQLRLVYFATDSYSEPFLLGIKTVIEEFNGKYTGCYGCGRCGEKLQGYTYQYPDGKKVFRCGRELIELPPLTMQQVDEVKAMMKMQNEFWESE